MTSDSDGFAARKRYFFLPRVEGSVGPLMRTRSKLHSRERNKDAQRLQAQVRVLHLGWVPHKILKFASYTLWIYLSRRFAFI